MMASHYCLLLQSFFRIHSRDRQDCFTQGVYSICCKDGQVGQVCSRSLDSSVPLFRSCGVLGCGPQTWIAQRVTELLGIEDDVLIGYVFEQLDPETHKVP